jgi:hypothetical protein
MRRRTLLGLAGGAALGSLAPERLAGAAPFTHEESLRLRDHLEVRVPLDVDLPQGAYFGGIVYLLITSSVDEVMTLATDPGRYGSILPMTREVRVLAQRGRDMQVYLRQGEGLGSVSYVLLVRRESEGLLRFWIDPSQPHDLDDGWGFFRVEPWPKQLWWNVAPQHKYVSLMTWGVLMRIDSDWQRNEFSESLRANATMAPQLIRQCIYRHPSCK